MIKEKLEEIAEKFNSLFVNKEYYFYGAIYDNEGILRERYSFVFTPTNWFVSELAGDDKNLKFALMMRDNEGRTHRPITLFEKIESAIYEYSYDNHTSMMFIHHIEGRFEFSIQHLSKDELVFLRR